MPACGCNMSIYMAKLSVSPWEKIALEEYKPESYMTVAGLSMSFQL